MEMSMERDSSALGSLFQQIINDMKNTSPLWEDFVAKASKLHACLRAAIQAIAAYLDAFQKIADAATNSRGASKEIGTALTRVCLRHKAVETRLKTFTAAIMDCLVQPLQDKLEDWKRSVATIDKEHAKEYKRCRTELKKRSTDTLRLQKKARKGQSDTLQSLMDSHMQDVTMRRAELEEVEKKSLRSAMIEERMRYCSFVHMLQPVVKEECEVMSELGHLQEAMQSIALVTKEPQVLPAASEELIHDAKASILLYPESPSASAGGGGSLSQGGCSNSLGSRKSSVCSISSMNSSGSSNSPGHPHYPRSLSQASSINNPSHAVTTWPTHSQDTVDLPSNASERPHTISSAYEKGHQRPPLTVYTFQNPETIHEGCGNNIALTGGSSSGQNTPSTQKSPAGALTRPPLPVRCSSLERPLTANSNRGGNGTNLMQRQCPSPIPAHVTKDSSGNVVENDERSRASVLQKAYMFEKQAAAVKSTPIPPANASVGLTRNLENNSNSGIYGTRSSNNQQQQQQPPQSQSIDPQEVGSTRIARRSSVNTAKPPPPVRRSSSVTPSPNTPTTPTNANATNMLHQQAHSLNTSTENLPPPPAYLLEARQTTPTTPPSAMPNSSQKVSETVKALSGLRHQPASPHTLRRLQQQQQQQQHHQQHQSMLQSPLHQHYNQQHNIYSPTITTPTSPIILPMHDEPEYDAYYNTYVEVPTTSFIADKDNCLFITPTKTNPNANVALTLNNAIPSNKIISPIYQQPPKQYQHQYTKSSPVLMSPQTPTSTTKRTTTPTPPTPLSPQNAVTALHQMDFDDIPPPLPPPNPNHHHHPQLSLPLRYQQQLPTPNSNNNHMPSSQQMQKQHQQQHNHHHNQQQQQYHEQLQQLDYNNGEALYGTNSPTSFRTSSPGGGIYAQPKILNNMSSFRTNSPGPNGHQTPTTSSTTTQSHVPAQPKTNPNLIAQLNARLNSSKQQNTNEAIYGVTTVNHQQQQHHQREEIYMHNYQQQQQQQQQHQQQQMSTHTSQPPQQLQQQQTYDAAEANANASITCNTNQNQYSSTQYYAPKHLTAAHQQHPSHQQQQSQKVANVATNNAQQMRQSSSHQTLPMSQMSPMPPSTEQATAAHQQQSHYQIGSHHHHQQQLQQQQHIAQHYTCPPPLEDPPPPPIHNANNNSATMPKRGSSSHHHHHNHNQQQSVNLATYAAASSASTLPKNMIQQQRILQQQQQQHQGIYGTATHQAQQQQYHAPAAISAGHQHAQQYQNPQHISQRPPMPLPHHQQQQPQQQQPHPQHQQQSSSTTGNRHKTATINATKQPPVPSRHSSVQQKIFVATNPFIQTTTIHCHSPNSSSVHSQPASPVCNSPTPSSVASIYGTSSRRSSGSGSSVVAPGGMSHYDVSGGGNNAGAVYYNHQLNTAPNTNYTSTNVDKTTSIRSKAKAEFLENLNAKLAKQSLSGRAFAVRNLINSKALPDPRICHESLMDQIKRGATLKRNQKINDRSAPKIY